MPAAELPSGHYMNLLIGSANRDVSLFAEPETFDLHRENLAEHLAFGRGTCSCVGPDLAKMEGVISTL